VPDERPAAERLRELDEREPEPGSPAADGGPEEPDAPSPGVGRYMWIVGIAFAVLAVWAAFQSTRQAPRSDFLRGLPAGTPLPDFAAPLATGRLEGDANVSQGRDDSGAAGARPACEVRSPDVVNVCELRERPLVLTFVVTRGAACAPELSVVDRVARDYPRVAFAAVVSGDSRERVAALVRQRRIRMPVAVDRDGAVVNLYRVGVCPTITFAERGGTVRATRIGGLSERALRRDLDALARAGR
jgi:AhpC/TSA family